MVDRDAVRSTVTQHLGFSLEVKYENNLSFIALCQTNTEDNDVTPVPKISSSRDQRASAWDEFGTTLVEDCVQASLKEVIRRSPKGLYRSSMEGGLSGLIGVSPAVPYHAPEETELTLNTESDRVQICAQMLVDFLSSRVGPV